jgi:hypothetical protein
MVMVIAAAVVTVLVQLPPIGGFAVLPRRSWLSSLLTSPEAAAAIIDVVNAVDIAIVHILD